MVKKYTPTEIFNLIVDNLDESEDGNLVVYLSEEETYNIDNDMDNNFMFYECIRFLQDKVNKHFREKEIIH